MLTRRGAAVNSGKVVVVTGASTGFGRVISETLARRGYQVFATMRRVHGRNAPLAAEIESLAQREGLSLRILEIDVTDDRSVESAIDEVMAMCGRIDILVNNAGYAIVDLMESVTPAQAQRLFDTNVFGAVRMNRAVLPAMRRQGSGLLLHVSSGAGRLAIPAMGFYCASKFALEALAEVYRYELASLGIDSVVIEPGACRTAITVNLETGEDPSRSAGYGEAASLPGRMSASISGSQADPQDLADGVLQIIETPAGQRNLRYRISASDGGVSRINGVTEEVQGKLLDAFGITEITKFRQH
jgi:NAD(P)-dependent dehydrogenase (short-subunit alcohol dehydrogenase family)